VGGGGSDISMSIELDAEGNIYLAGTSRGLGFPTTAGVFQSAHAGESDVVVYKMDSSGSKLIFSTFVGGAKFDLASCTGSALEIDAAGNSYVAGTTGSSDFPTTPGAFDTTYDGGADDWGEGDAFAFKLSPDGRRLLYSTFLAGSGREQEACIAVDEAGDMIVSGQTASTDFPTTGGAFDASHNGRDDFFISRIRPDGKGAGDLKYSTFLGGSSQEWDGTILVDNEGVVHLLGESLSEEFPVTPGAYDRTFNGGNDFVIVRLSTTGAGRADLLYSTFLGGSGPESRDGNGTGIALGPGGDIFITGESGSTHTSRIPFPVTPGAFNTRHNGGSSNPDDVVVARLRPSGKGVRDLVYSTYYGGSGDDEDPGIGVDSQGNAYVIAETESADIPLVDPVQTENKSDQSLALFVLDPTGSNLLFSTYLSGSDDEANPDLYIREMTGAGNHAATTPVGPRRAVSDNVAIFVVGRTKSADFPTTEGAFDTTHNGDTDHFITKIVNQITEQPAPVTAVSAASFTAPVAVESIATAFAEIPVDAGVGAPGTPLPTELGGVTIQIVDSQEAHWPAELFYAGPTQVNLFVPAGVAAGVATINILVDGEIKASGTVEVRPVAPGVFFVGQQPQVAAAFSLTIAPDGTRTETEVFEANLAPKPIDLGREGTAVYLLLFGTGVRNASSVAATVGGENIPILGYVPQGVFVGLDQINIGPLPQSLAGAGVVDVVLTVDGVVSNAVVVRIK
jgi:uncharacterized protein (TIGR03437 family)